mgnify:CR=1 FL=1
MRILLLSLNYAPEPVGIGPYSAGLAEALAERGHALEVIAGEPYYPQWRRDPAYGGGYQHTVEHGVRVTRCPHYIPAEPGGLKRVVHLASFALSALVPVLKRALHRSQPRPQLVVTVAPALLGVVTAWLAARLYGAKLWIHVQDFEVEAAFATGLMNPRGLLPRFARWLEGRLLRLGDRVSTISPQMLDKLKEKGVLAERALEIRNWADARFVPDPAGAATIRAEWNLGTRKVALYSGNIARKQGIEILVEAARLLQARPDIAFVICGEGPNRANLEELAAGLDNVQLHDLQPAERMGAMLSMADLHLLPQIAGAADLVLPSKLTNMLASGRPVVATTEPGTGLYGEVEGCGSVTPPGDAQALAASIAALLDDPDRRARLGAAASDRARERWARDSIIARFEAELERL